MIKLEETKTDLKREEIIQKLVNKGVYKVHDKQLYQLTFFELMKKYTSIT